MTQVKLKGITWDHPRGYKPLVASSARYFQEKGVEVEWQIRSLKDFGDQSLEELSRQFDLLIIDHPHSGIAAKSNCLTPLDRHVSLGYFKQLKSESAGPSFMSYNYQGHQWAFPIDAAFQSACYRPDLIEKRMLPESWDEVFELANTLRSKGEYIGMALCPTDALCTFLSISAQLGAPIKEENNDLISDDEGIRVLSLMKKIRNSSHPQSVEWNPIDLYDHMSEDDDVVYSPLAFNYTNYSREGFRKSLLTYTNPPGLVSLLGGAGIAISTNCVHIPEAIDYASWICSGNVQAGIYTEHEGQPGNVSAWKNKKTNSYTTNFFSNTQKALEAAYVRPRSAWWPDFQEQLGNQVNRFLKEDLDEIGTIETLKALYTESKSKQE